MKSKNLFLDLFHYIKIFQKYLGPRIYIVTLLSLVAALSEGIGFLIVLPLFEVLGTSEESEMTGVGELLYNFYIHWLGWLAYHSDCCYNNYFSFKGAISFWVDGIQCIFNCKTTSRIKRTAFR